MCGIRFLARLDIGEVKRAGGPDQPFEFWMWVCVLGKSEYQKGHFAYFYLKIKIKLGRAVVTGARLGGPTFLTRGSFLWPDDFFPSF